MSTDSIISKMIDQIAQARASDINRRLARCESPIEKLFCVSLIGSWLGEHPETMPWPDFVPTEARTGELAEINWHTPAQDPLYCMSVFGRLMVHYQVCGVTDGQFVGGSEWGALDVVGTFVQPEVKDSPRPIRLDVAIIGKGVKIAVELDGHDFHERTKEQAASDKSRDRILVSMGWKVVRFAGSEVYKNPTGCSWEISKLLTVEELRARHAK